MIMRLMRHATPILPSARMKTMPMNGLVRMAQFDAHVLMLCERWAPSHFCEKAQGCQRKAGGCEACGQENTQGEYPIKAVRFSLAFSLIIRVRQKRNHDGVVLPIRSEAPLTIPTTPEVLKKV